ncbi:hypothetical protein VTN00DRAFT_4761 [Thermoascus crustaceus]|uniref:uncharacterized protein n=1 Tax=Thermoascus crustaceus TaxID=5088 RepID=UPI0037421138
MSKPSASASGITVDAVTGERLIPSSTRADGSKRREIRIRPGYRPPEDIEVYKNRAAEAWKNRGKGGVPGAEGLKDDTPAKNTSASSNKNAKKREAKRRAKAAADQNEGATAENGEGKEVDNADKTKPDDQQQSATASEPAVDPEAEKEKKARNLKKKLRQARDLRDKKDKGEALLPEQLEKVIKIQELIRQLDALGFDANGEKKVPAEDEKQEDKV